LIPDESGQFVHYAIGILIDYEDKETSRKALVKAKAFIGNVIDKIIREDMA